MNSAVFVDFENLYLSLKSRNDGTGLRTRELCLSVLQGMKTRLRQKGHNMVVGRSYAAFDTYPGVEVAHDLALMGLDPQYVLISHSGKNAADVQLAVDVARVVFKRPEIEMIVIVSGDRDFIPLARQVLEEGRELRVVAIPDTTSGDLRERVGEERFVDALALLDDPELLKRGDSRAAAGAPPPAKAAAVEVVENRVQAAAPVAAVEHVRSTNGSGPVIVGHVPVTWKPSRYTEPQTHEERLEQCLELLIKAQHRHNSPDIWLSPFLKGPMSQYFSSLVHPERRALINDLRNRQVIRVEERENAYADHPYSVIVIEETHAMVKGARARLFREQPNLRV